MEKEDSTKNKLLNTAKELFSKQGYKATTIRDIAKTANVNSALIKYHFENKQGVLIAIANEANEGGSDTYEEILDFDISNIGELKVRLHIFLDTLITKTLGRYDALRIIKNEAYELSTIESFHFSETSYSYIIRFAKFLEIAQSKGIINKDINLNILSDNLISLCIDQVFNWKTNIHTLNFDISDKKTRKEWVDQTLKMFLFGIASNKKG